MPISGTYWGAPCAGFGWIFPLIGLVFMTVMIIICARMMRGRTHVCWMCGSRGQRGGPIENLRNDVRK